MEYKLICLHFEISAFSGIVPDCPNTWNIYEYHWPYSQRMNFHLYVDNYDLQLFWLFYVYSVQ